MSTCKLLLLLEVKMSHLVFHRHGHQVIELVHAVRVQPHYGGMGQLVEHRLQHLRCRTCASNLSEGHKEMIKFYIGKLALPCGCGWADAFEISLR